MSVTFRLQNMLENSVSPLLIMECQKGSTRLCPPARYRDPNTASACPSSKGRSSFGYSDGSYSISASCTRQKSPDAFSIAVRTLAPLP